MVKEMELTLYHNFMLESENLFGKESNDFKFWNAKWPILYDIAAKFDFVDKLQR